MQEVNPDENRCHVCGEQCAVMPGTFDLPDGTSGLCCGICGPKVEKYIETMDYGDLPDGPLKQYLWQKGEIACGTSLLSLMRWLWGMLGRVEFFMHEDEMRVKASCPKPGSQGERCEFQSDNLITCLQGLHQYVQAQQGAVN